ncbi:MAG: leucine-rich repeat protein, partial [Christensenellaceae bacterium]|nr:leucine-rich repeat protein [Christensenellaceae bacterium]
ALKTIALPEGLTTLGEKVFASCNALERVTMPKSLSEIGYGLFYDTPGLRVLEYRGNSSAWRKVEKAKDWDEFAGTNTIKYVKSGN